jgi:hypothetical protein
MNGRRPGSTVGTQPNGYKKPPRPNQDIIYDIDAYDDEVDKMKTNNGN